MIHQYFFTAALRSEGVRHVKVCFTKISDGGEDEG